MSQHDYNLDNQDGASFRADINQALGAIVTLNSGAVEPNPTFAGMLWQDDTAGVLKRRNAANTGWVTLRESIEAAPLSRLLTAETAKATTSGTAIDFTAIPNWVKRITIMFRSVSTSGTSAVLVRVGSGSVLTSGYTAEATICGNATVTGSQTTGFNVTQSGAASDAYSGTVTLAHLGSNIWTSSGALTRTQGGLTISAGSVSLSGVLDRIRITTAGADTFDAGSVNILYE